MNSQTIYIRVVPADKNRGFVLLVGFEATLTQSRCDRYTTLSGITRAVITAAVERMKEDYNATTVKDVTAASVLKKLAKMFGEDQVPEE